MPSKKNKKFHLLPRLIVGLFMAIAVAQTVAAVGAFNAPEMALAQSEDTFKAQVPIPNAKIVFDNTTRPIAQYVKAVYTYAVGAVGILATVMLMIGGLRWILAGGNPSSVGEAKDMIIAAISGMVLVMTSYLILSQINPALVNLESNVAKITSIEEKEKDNSGSNGNSNCEWVKIEMNQYCKNVKGEGWVNIDSNNCSSNTKPAGEDALKYECCCPPIPEGCPSNRSIDCKACDGCQVLNGNPPCKADNCQLSSGIAKKLSKVYDSYKGWQVTEAWPPTYDHKSTCHTNGLCADINFSDRSDDPDKVKILAEKLIAEGLTSFQYECKSSAVCCSKYDEKTNCKYNPDANGNHFHVNN